MATLFGLIVSRAKPFQEFSSWGENVNKDRKSGKWYIVHIACHDVFYFLNNKNSKVIMPSINKVIEVTLTINVT